MTADPSCVPPDAYYDEQGHIIKKCWCGKEGAFGYGVSMRQGKLGKYYCFEHWPDRPPPPPPPTTAPDLQELVARFGGYDKITPDA
jgi:hypothetical protein